MEYDAYGNATHSTDALGRTTVSTFEGDSFHLHSVVTTLPAVDGVIHQTEQEMSLRFGKPLSRTDLNDNVTYFEYDDLGRIICVAEPGDSLSNCHGAAGPFTATTEFHYAFGDPMAATFEGKLSSREVRVPNPSATGYNRSTAYVDALGRSRYQKVQRTLDGDDPTAPPSDIIEGQVDLDGEGRVVASYVAYPAAGGLADPGAAGIAFSTLSYELNATSAVDPLGRVHRLDPPGNLEFSETTYLGSRTETRDARGAVAVTVRDHLGRTVAEESHDSSGLVTYTTYQLDGQGRVLKRQVNGDATTLATFMYDTLGRLVERTDPDSAGTWLMGYDEVGNLVFSDDPESGQHVQVVYDGLDRPVVRCIYSTDAYNATATATDCGANGEDEATFFYSESFSSEQVGRLTRAVDAYGEETFWYDQRGRVVAQRREVNGKIADTSFSYDSVGRLLSVTYPDTEVYDYGYNAAGQVISLVRSTWGRDIAVE